MKKAFSEWNSLLTNVHPLILTLAVLSCVGMNLLANKSIDTGLSWLALDCGILFSWLAFLSMDVATHCYGPRAATAVSLTALLLNLVMVAVFFVASIVPGVWGESFVEGSEQVINGALDNTFGGTWFIILGRKAQRRIFTTVKINSFLISSFLKRKVFIINATKKPATVAIDAPTIPSFGIKIKLSTVFKRTAIPVDAIGLQTLFDA
jgi:uncharacterized PurR-regulated membrane protein YhhQ (DUF165 family)